jgi:hypothetical protein
LSAQQDDKDELRSSAPSSSVAINPLFLPFGTVTIEYEQRISAPDVTLGISGWYEYDNVLARWIYVKGMYYTSGIALQGFAVGATAGFIRSYRKQTEPLKRAADNAPIVGIMVQNNWRFGETDTYLFGIGFGARMSVKSISPDSPLRRFDGDVRLVVGLTL